MLGVRPEKIPVQRREWIGPAPSVRTEIPGPNAVALLATLSKGETPSTDLGTPVVVRRALGTVVEDVDGNRFLDFCAGVTAGTPGHAHPRIVAGLESQVGSIAADGRTLLSAAGSELVERLSALLADVMPYRAIVSGRPEEACSVAAAIAQAHRNRRTIVTFNELGQPGAARLPGPTEVVVLDWPFDAIDLSSFRTQLDRAGVKRSDIAAVVMKPFATTRACDSPNATFADDLSSFCCDNDILLVFDETVSGMGRTGEWFAFEHLHVKPQIILAVTGLAAGLPLAAALVAEEIAATVPQSILNVESDPHPICCATATALIDLVHSTAMSNARKVGERLGARLAEIAEGSKAVGQVRGLGLLHIVGIINRKTHKPDPKRRDMVLRNCLQRGLLLAPVWEAGIQICPPACMNEPQLDVGFRLFEEALARLP